MGPPSRLTPLRRDRLRATDLAGLPRRSSPKCERSLEAAGVEPASESTPSKDSTCVAALECSRLTSKCDRNRQTLAPNCLVAPRRNSTWRPACFYDIQPRPAGEFGVDVATV